MTGVGPLQYMADEPSGPGSGVTPSIPPSFSKQGLWSHPESRWNNKSPAGEVLEGGNWGPGGTLARDTPRPPSFTPTKNTHSKSFWWENS